ncbi:hypothetical protein BDW42DRAFT_177883 [Aspergillus taichungensis]|uniref:Uncharacterized protein n=1 Tax=Aspergillus taichungensis TaxID=482145 RepID=A0A2J5HII2_9EURO|nr:hypothetical protein BDW42DRAFT_177883 [Aspergillus taichungensis]
MDFMGRLFNGPLAKQLFTPPEVTLRILGTQLADDGTRVTDFDIKIDCSNYMKINSEEYLTKREHCHRKSSGWLHNQLVERDRHRRWTVRKVVAARDDEIATIGANVARLALGSSYTGLVEYVLCTPPVEMYGLPDESTAVARVVWGIDCSFIVSQGTKSGRGASTKRESWYDLLLCAMLEGLQRSVSPQDPPLFYSQALIYSDESNYDASEDASKGSQGPR